MKDLEWSVNFGELIIVYPDSFEKNHQVEIDLDYVVEILNLTVVEDMRFEATTGGAGYNPTTGRERKMTRAEAAEWLRGNATKDKICEILESFL
jgi:hypothetical protein